MNIKALLFAVVSLAIVPASAAEMLPVEWFGDTDAPYAIIQRNYGQNENPKTPEDFAKLLSLEFVDGAMVYSTEDKGDELKAAGIFKDVENHPPVKNCLDVLAIDDASFFYEIGFSAKARACLNISVVSQMKPSGVSYWRDFKFTRKAINEFPVEIGHSLFKGWLPYIYEDGKIASAEYKNFGAVAVAIAKEWDSGATGAYHHKGENRPPLGELKILGKSNAVRGHVYFDILARGDYNSDGIEDVLMSVDGAGDRSGSENLYVLSKKSKTGQVHVVKALLINGIPVDQIKRHSVLEYRLKWDKERMPSPKSSNP